MSGIRKYIKIKTIIVALLVMLVLLAVGYPLFSYFRISTDARLALREAKNVKITMKLFDVKMYSEDKCSYNSKKKNNMEDGLMAEIENDLEHSCYVSIIEYDQYNRMVTHFIYGYKDYIVEYRYVDNQDEWVVKYAKTILDYSN